MNYYIQNPAMEIQFDDLETHEHTKCKPLSVALAVERKTWCTTKTLKGLIDHLSIYVAFHNQRLTKFRLPSTAIEAS